MAPGGTRSLMDDSEFLAELEQLEPEPSTKAAPRAPISSPILAPLDVGPKAEPESAAPQDDPQPRQTIDAYDVMEEEGLSLGQRLAAAVVFLLLAALGAAGAAFVFHDRVAELLARLR